MLKSWIFGKNCWSLKYVLLEMAKTFVYREIYLLSGFILKQKQKTKVINDKKLLDNSLITDWFIQ